LIGSPEEKRPLGREARVRDNIKVDLWDTEYEYFDWIQLPHDRDQSAVMTIRVPEKRDNFLTSWANAGISRRAVLQGISYKQFEVWKRKDVSANTLVNGKFIGHPLLDLSFSKLWLWRVLSSGICLHVVQ
jgi:hypothetical protein